eukprot:SAG31_NODE_141_length_22675_cov_48.948879_18_plen_55_part_00
MLLEDNQCGQLWSGVLARGSLRCGEVWNLRCFGFEDLFEFKSFRWQLRLSSGDG